MNACILIFGTPSNYHHKRFIIKLKYQSKLCKYVRNKYVKYVNPYLPWPGKWGTMAVHPI